MQLYSAGYAAARYIHSEIIANDGSGIREVFAYLSAHPLSTLDDALAAVRDQHLRRGHRCDGRRARRLGTAQNRMEMTVNTLAVMNEAIAAQANALPIAALQLLRSQAPLRRRD